MSENLNWNKILVYYLQGKIKDRLFKIYSVTNLDYVYFIAYKTINYLIKRLFKILILLMV